MMTHMQRRVGAPRKNSALLKFALATVVFWAGALPLFAQNSSNPYSNESPENTSELARENLKHVAASAPEIEAILHKDEGLLVELKSWIAKRATEQGQVVTDSDLTDVAIFERLRSDVEFRSVATRLVQRYGYLTPQLNPFSQEGKEQDLVSQERAKWIAMEQEQQREGAHAAGYQQNCSPPQSANCTSRPASPASRPDSGSGGGPPQPPNLPANTPFNPPNASPSPTQRTQSPQIYQTGASQTDLLSQMPMASGDSLSSLGALGQANPTGGMPGQTTGGLPSSDPFSPSNLAPPGTMGAQLPSDFASASNANAISSQNANSAEAALHALSNSNGTDRGEDLDRTALVHGNNPYLNVPSLYDMYMQAAPWSQEPRRFGIDVFENGTHDAQMIPMDFPVGPDYVLGPGDSLAIDVWGGVSQRVYRTVDREGRVNLPEAGPVLVSGKTLGDVQASVQQLLRTQFRDVSADVSLARLRTIRVYVVGDVQHPGAYDISSLSTPLNALFAAGGPTSRGSLRIVRHYRNSELVQDVDVYDLLLHGVRTGIQRLENGDTVLVPPLGPEVTVEGLVRRPAIYEVHGEKSLSDMLELAGGMLPSAALQHIEVQRLEAHEKRTMVTVDVPQNAGVAAAMKQLASFPIQDGDKIRLFPIAPYNQDAIYLEGHVVRPGRYSYHDGMKLSDLLAGYSDLMPEPAMQYAEIIRLNPPDYRPTVESFDLAAAFSNPASAPEIKPLDTIQIFGRYDFENPPTVSVLGQVRKPGPYRTSGKIHLVDAVQLAGGLSPEASTTDAQVYRYLPDGKMKIFSVDLRDALAGNPEDNIVLESRDRVLIHKSLGQIDPPTVYAQGEVANPGRYPLTSNMTVADLIRVAGGLKRSADPVTADLTHYLAADELHPLGENEKIELASAMKVSNGAADTGTTATATAATLRNGDVLTIREMPGWNDLGASITLRGEVQHPGKYGIKAGEKLSSVIERAGGFTSQAYPYGAVLERTEVREMQEKERAGLVLRVRDAQAELKSETTNDPHQKASNEAAYQQWQTEMEALANNPPVGRVTIHISSDVRRWQNSSNDIEVRAGDRLTLPKKPQTILVSGQVYNPTAISYRPGKSANWYLAQSGGPTQLAAKGKAFVIRADGTVAGSEQGSGWWSGRSMDSVLQPGDMIVVPEKALGGGKNWPVILQSAQIGVSLAYAALIASGV
jgi:protein involved in polysaccharide export with SLBB domain